MKIDFSASAPIFLQIRNQIVMGIANGDLKSGERLPTVRALAVETGVNMMTVSKAYQLLTREGYIATGRRGGTVVSGTPPRLSEQTVDELRLLISQLKLCGLSQDELLALCAQIYNGEEVTQ